MKDLIHLYDSAGLSSRIDHSLKFNKLERNEFTQLIFGNSEVVNIGLHKPFFKLWFEIDSSSREEDIPIDFDLAFEINLDGTWTSLNIIDETFNFTQSGFISFEADNWKPFDIGLGVESYYIRWSLIPKVVAELPFINFVGANIIYNDDLSLENEIRNIKDYLYRDREGNTDKSFIKYHVSTRDDIVQALIVGGYLKDDCDIKRFSKWDIIDFDAINVPCKYHTLGKIFLDNSTNVEDKNYIRGMYYMSKYGESFKVYTLGIDSDDDGKIEDSEYILNTVHLVKV